ncbi:MAG: hypothetical protein J6P19_01630 [Acetobacter sp.]|nr:hypothetical protein [Acetobacter sp.]
MMQHLTDRIIPKTEITLPLEYLVRVLEQQKLAGGKCISKRILEQLAVCVDKGCKDLDLLSRFLKDEYFVRGGIVDTDLVKFAEAFGGLQPYFKEQENTLIFDSESFLKDIEENRFQKKVFDYDFNSNRFANEAKSKAFTIVSSDMVRTLLLECDYSRTNLVPYTADFLTSPKKGHWELWDPKDETFTVKLPEGESFMARPPHMDVMKDAVCAIDFGTKSTVVACRYTSDGKTEERLLRVGVGDYAKAPEIDDYENPTVIRLVDFNSFKQAYANRVGRPYTKWNDLPISHTAADTLRNQVEKSEIYYSVFSDLKQWTKDDRCSPFIDQRGYKIQLERYKELKEDDFDPIEIYAYYLGLAINNMYRGICLNYLLSFPVTYETEVRERILKSFERGLKKSFPSALLNDQEVMKGFRVYAGASEPAAYAACALSAFGLEPKKEGEVISYAVFDFGGGTTDYDFGTMRIPDEGSYNFLIERLGHGGGDPFLGGENILALLAYEVYKDNLSIMREHHIPIALPPKGQRLAGTETLVQEMKAASHQAQMNLKVLSEKLRPIWEQPKNYRKKFEEQETTEFELFKMNPKEGEKETVSVALRVSVDRLEECIEKVVRQGVEDFFMKLLHAFSGLQSRQIHILLAGNSCKSLIVQKLFNERVTFYEKKFTEERTNTQENDRLNMFVLHLPLGVKNTCEDDETDDRADKPEQFDIDQVRTGKTGVVFGLLRTRKGGKDIKMVERDIEQGEITFPYYLGNIDRNKHFRVRIGQGVGYNQWTKFIVADEEEFELYYTKEARALNNDLSSSEVSHVRCEIDSDDVNEDGYIYIAKMSPDTIAYGVAASKEESVEDSEIVKRYTKKLI